MKIDKIGVCLWILTGILCMTVAAVAGEPVKLDKKVLYVGYSPEKEPPVYNQRRAGFVSEELFFTEVKTRMNAFESMLSQFFTQVTTVDARDYRQDMSSGYDVTIFDALPEPVVPVKDVRDSSGRFLRTQQARYLDRDFDSPTIFIAHTGGVLQEGLELKINWYCLCLNTYAFRLDSKHEVFKGPFPVRVVQELKDTPLPAYGYLNGYAVPDRIPMWRVQKAGYRDGKGHRIGLVSFDDGFGDSPDAEVIAGGESLKSIDAVAIGRHGNFMLWGFGASPDEMTPEAQVVFANSVAYMSKFRGARPVVRKGDKVMTPRSFVDDLLFVVSKDGYKHYVAKKDMINKDRLLQKEKAEKMLKDKGAGIDRAALDKKYEPSEVLAEEAFFRRYLGDKLGDMAVADRKKCRKYIYDNRACFYGAGTFNQFVIDEEARSLGVPNNDKKILEKCISLLENKQDEQTALRLLKRYTLYEFTQPQEWRTWYEQHKEVLFFTESGGYKFMENRITRCEIKTSPEQRADKPVQVSARVLNKDGKRYISVRFAIREGYHIYATLEEGAPFLTTSLDFRFPAGIVAAGALQKPEESLYEGGDGIMIYRGDVEFLQEISSSGSGNVKCIAEYQCCDSTICLTPEKQEVDLFL